MHRVWLWALPLLVLAQPAFAQTGRGQAAARHLHAGASAFGCVDMERMRGFRHYRALLASELERMEIERIDRPRIRRLLGRTTEVCVSIVPGPRRGGQLATLHFRGNYIPNEVPDAILAVLPGMLQPLWHETTIEGRPAWDVGVAALVDLGGGEWLLARRLDGDFPLDSRDAPASMSGAAAAWQRAYDGGAAAWGMLVGSDDTRTARRIPEQFLGFLFYNATSGEASLTLGEGATLDARFEHHDAETAARREAYVREYFDRAAERIDGDVGGATPAEIAVTREGAAVRLRLALSPAHTDAWIARLVERRPIFEAEGSGGEDEAEGSAKEDE